MRRQQAGLLQLLADDRITQLPVDEAFRRITEVAGRTLEIERTSVWLFDDSRTHIRCHNLYRRSLRQHMAGASLEAAHTRPTSARWKAAAPSRPRTRTATRAPSSSPPATSSRSASARCSRRRSATTAAWWASSATSTSGRRASGCSTRRATPPRSRISSRWCSMPSERARLGRRLGRSEERYRTFVSLSTEGILRVEISPPVALDAPAGGAGRAHPPPRRRGRGERLAREAARRVVAAAPRRPYARVAGAARSRGEDPHRMDPRRLPVQRVRDRPRRRRRRDAVAARRR